MKIKLFALKIFPFFSRRHGCLEGVIEQPTVGTENEEKEKEGKEKMEWLVGSSHVLSSVQLFG